MGGGLLSYVRMVTGWPTKEPGGEEVVEAAAGRGSGPGHLACLENEATEETTGHRQKIGHCQAQDQDGELTIAKPGLQKCTKILITKIANKYYLVFLNMMTEKARRLPRRETERRRERTATF